MRVLVTGAGGFVGRWLTSELEAAGHEVAGPSTEALDVTDRAAWVRTLEHVRPDAIAHLAAVAYAPDAADDPANAFRVTVGGTLDLVEALRQTGQRPGLLVSGSSEVYGAPRPDALPIDEAAPLMPRTPYAISKVAQEAVAVRAATDLPLPVAVTRSFNHTGPGQRPVFVVPALASRVMAVVRNGPSKRVRVGNLDVCRDFTDVRDVVRAYRLLLEHVGGGSAAPGASVLNVARGRSVSIRSILEGFIRLSGVPIEFEVDPALVRPDDPPNIYGDASALTALTGWQPERDFSETLADIWATAEPTPDPPKG
ncbi:MAG: GDP-mannose 4,6-dehydratase [Chloroflexi bacterium]|nr:GDP-mannose 4,6-dehydratase [Chloroflexota bacterium]